MKITEHNGFKYSRQEFEGYSHRAKFEFEVKDQRFTSSIDVYTNNSNVSQVKEFIISKTTEKVKTTQLINWVTKKQDDLTAQFIEETFKNW